MDDVKLKLCDQISFLFFYYLFIYLFIATQAFL